MPLIHRVQAWHDEHPNCPISGKAIGKALALTTLERHEVQCWNIQAIDESKRQRETRNRARKRQADRERASVQRRKHGRMLRSECLAKAERRRAFCEQHGITDHTLGRWLKQGKAWIVNGDFRSLSPCDTPLESGATDFGRRAVDPSVPLHGIGYWL